MSSCTCGRGLLSMSLYVVSSKKHSNTFAGHSSCEYCKILLVSTDGFPGLHPLENVPAEARGANK